MKKEVKLALIAIVVIMIVVSAVFFGVKKSNNEDNVNDNELASNNGDVSDKKGKNETKDKSESKDNIKIFNGDDRPIAFMIDNNVNAQPQASISKAYIVYEIIVEGNESRLMAIFKGVDADSVGPIRSSRHYFLDYAMENDAIYAHLGMSPQAEADFSKYKINNINGQIYDTGKARTDSSKYWRVTHKKAPHNAYTNTSSILQIAKDKGYKTTSNKDSVLNYVSKEVKLDSDNAIECNSVTIPYSSSHKVKYVYDAESGRYTRWSKGKKMTDEVEKVDITTKNIIITFAKNYTLDDGENKGRQDVVTVGSLDGYYITNGKAIKIKCVKNSRESQTKYTDLDGKEIEVNDGNTWVNVCPIDANVVIE